MARTERSLNASRPSAAGFTAIEMMVVVSIIILLVAMTVPSIFPAIKKGRVHDAANAIMRVSSQARQLARTRQQPTIGPGGAVTCYGVAVIMPTTGPAYAVLTYDSSAPTAPNSSSELHAQGDPTKFVAKLEFNRNVVPFMASAGGTKTPMTSGQIVSWYYQYRTGFVIQDGSSSHYTSPINVGTPAVAAVAASGSTPAQPAIPAGTPPDFGVCSLDQQYIVAVAIYSIGLGNAQDMK